MAINGVLRPDRLAFFQAIKDEVALARYDGNNVTQKSVDLETKRFPAPVPAVEYRDHFTINGLWARLEAVTGNLDADSIVLTLESINSSTPPNSVDVKAPQEQDRLTRLVTSADLSSAEADAISALGDNRVSRADQIREAHPTMQKTIVPGRVEQAEAL